MDNENNAAEIIQQLTTATLQPVIPRGSVPFIVVPEGYKKEELNLDHIEQAIQLDEAASLIAYTKQFQTSTTRIFASVSDTCADFVTVLDYHEGGRDGVAKYAKHVARYRPPFSPEFQAWLAIHGKQLTQSQFLDHLRKWGNIITSQSDADLVELASSLDFQTTGEFSSHVERTHGGRKLLFNERVEGSAQVKGKRVDVPDKMKLSLPIFVGGRDYDVDVDLLYRPQGGELRIVIELVRHHLVVRQALKDIVTEIKEGTGIEPFLGRLA